MPYVHEFVVGSTIHQSEDHVIERPSYTATTFSSASVAAIGIATKRPVRSKELFSNSKVVTQK